MAQLNHSFFLCLKTRCFSDKTLGKIRYCALTVHMVYTIQRYVDDKQMELTAFPQKFFDLLI